MPTLLNLKMAPDVEDNVPGELHSVLEMNY